MSRVVRETRNWLYKLVGLAIAVVLLAVFGLGVLAVAGSMGVI